MFITGHSGDSTTSDVDQLYAKVAKKSKRPSPPPTHHHSSHASNHIGHSKNLGNHGNHVGNSNHGNHSPQPPVPPAHPPAGTAGIGIKYEHNNNHEMMVLGHIGSMLPPMTLKRKSSRASRGSNGADGGAEDDDNDPCYEMVGGGSGAAPTHGYGLLDQEEPKYERLKGYVANTFRETGHRCKVLQTELLCTQT